MTRKIFVQFLYHKFPGDPHLRPGREHAISQQSGIDVVDAFSTDGYKRLGMTQTAGKLTRLPRYLSLQEAEALGTSGERDGKITWGIVVYLKANSTQEVILHVLRRFFLLLFFGGGTVALMVVIMSPSHELEEVTSTNWGEVAKKSALAILFLLFSLVYSSLLQRLGGKRMVDRLWGQD